MQKLALKAGGEDLKDWKKLAGKIKNLKKTVKIGIVGKYFDSGDFVLTDSYISVIESIKHAAYYLKLKPQIEWLEAESCERSKKELIKLKKLDGIIIPGGFGSRGIGGKINAIEFCRLNSIPYFGLCYGMQLACVEYARHVAGLNGAHTTEIDKKPNHPVIDIMPEQKALMKENHFGGSMRLGAYACRLVKGTKAYSAYSKPVISERHRHRYEFNNEYREILTAKGLIISGVNPERDLVEIIELKNHPFFLGVQFHPEFKSRPLNPHPLFVEFIRACGKK